MIAFSCFHCGMKLQVKEQFAGRSSKCPTCKQSLVVPLPDKTQAFIPNEQIDGTPSSVHQAGLEGGVTLEHAVRPGQKSVQELLARPSKKGERYIIEREIARGGMGAVLRAVDCDIRREVAVKFMLDQADPKKKQRFIEEAQITGQLEHPNIPPVHELGTDAQKRLFFSMKMVKGRSLAQVLDELRQNPKTADGEYTLGRLLNILVNVCNGLGYAHSRGVVHRDLKPANIMVGDFGEVYVMDWGLAKVLKGGPRAAAPMPSAASGACPSESRVAVPVPGSQARRSSKVETSRDAEADLTQEGAVLGTPVYMPPEQATGRVDAIDHRSDIYSLGAILYEVLALQPPIDKEGGYLAVLMRVMQGEIIPPEQRAPKRARAGKIPKELAAVAMKAMATNPQDRYQNVEALRTDIERFQEGRSVSAKDDTFKEMTWKLVKRNKTVSAFTTVLAVVVLWALVANGLAQRDVEKAKADSQAKQMELVNRTRNAVPALVVAARQVANAGNIQVAREQVELALLYEPTDANAHLLRGQILLGQKEWTTARGELEQYLQQKNDADVKKLLELCSTGKVNDAATQSAVAEVLGRQNVPGPAIPLLDEVAAERKRREPLLPVYRKQIEVNWKGLGGKLSLGQDAQFDLNFWKCRQVTTLDPLKGMQLNTLNLDSTSVQDLTPLKGMPLTTLDLHGCGQVRDLTPLQGMSLTTLDLFGCGQVHDLTPLKGVPLTSLNLFGCRQVHDLTPLQGMPLSTLNLGLCSQVRDISALKGMPLSRLYLHGCSQLQDLRPLQGMSLTQLELQWCGQVYDLSPLKGMPLTWLNLDNTPVKDLTPLQGMNLQKILFNPKIVTKGMEYLRQMKSLTNLNDLPPAEFWKRYDAGEFK
ncbi:MAG: protein kinase [Gemmataceae bacterium]|nr:protein kinase [Gemmataceae bacterium]